MILFDLTPTMSEFEIYKHSKFREEAWNHSKNMRKNIVKKWFYIELISSNLFSHRNVNYEILKDMKMHDMDFPWVREDS